jgi:type IV secretory pathway TraG/TraD family ATPase VirD4
MFDDEIWAFFDKAMWGTFKLIGKGIVYLIRKENEDDDYVSTATNPPIANQLQSGTTNINGFIFGKDKNNRAVFKPQNADGHVLVVGGVGSGKSSCLAIPTLRHWGSSVFAIDIKGELYDKSYQYRPYIKVFDPKDNSAFGYDPYIFLRQSQNPAQEARAIAQAIIPLPPDIKEPFWIESAQKYTDKRNFILI